MRNTFRQTSRGKLLCPQGNHLIFWWLPLKSLSLAWFSQLILDTTTPHRFLRKSFIVDPTDQQVMQLFASLHLWRRLWWFRGIFSNRTTSHSCPQLLQFFTSLCKVRVPRLLNRNYPRFWGLRSFFRAFHNGQRTSQHYVAYSGRSLPCETELRHLGHLPAVRLNPLLQMGSYRPIWWVENISVEHIFRFIQSRKYIFGSIFHLI